MPKLNFNAFRLWILSCTALLLLSLLPEILFAQETYIAPRDRGKTLFRSIPEGVQVKLEGRSKVIGTTAFEIRDVYKGYYRVTALLDGYEPQSGYISFAKGNNGSLEVKAYPIRKWEIVLRSLFLPGWGQIHSGQSFKGKLVGGLGIGAMTLSAIAAFDYKRALDSYDRSTERYETALILEDIESYRKDMEDKFDRAEESYDRRQIALGALAGIWLFNVFDAVLFSPEFSVRAGGNSLTFYMTPKKRGMVFLRSLFLPGWGQYYMGERNKGILISFSQLTSLTTMVLAEASYREAVDRLDSAKAKYFEAISIEEIESSRDEMNSSKRDADDLHRLRQLSFGITLGIWGYNLLDSLLSFESPRITLGRVSARAVIGDKSAGIQMDIKF